MPRKEADRPDPWDDVVPSLRERLLKRLPGMSHDAESARDLEQRLPVLLRIAATRERKRALLLHLLSLYKSVPSEELSARYAKRWTFPDGHTPDWGFTVYAREHTDLVVTRAHYAQPSEAGNPPVCTIDLIQGVKKLPGQEVSVSKEEIESSVAKLIGSWRELHRTGWNLLLTDRDDMRYRKIRDLFFGPGPVPSPFGEPETQVYYPLNPARKRVQALGYPPPTPPPSPR